MLVIKGKKFLASSDMRKIVLVAIIVFIGLALLAAIIIPRLGLPTEKTKVVTRCRILKQWYYDANQFIETRGRLPQSLHEVVEDKFKKGGYFPYGMLVGLHQGDPGNLEDPNVFLKVVPYGFFSGKHGWFIKELDSTDKSFYLMIDQNGTIMKVQVADGTTPKTN
jgi:hypothetical protein